MRIAFAIASNPHLRLNSFKCCLLGSVLYFCVCVCSFFSSVAFLGREALGDVMHLVGSKAFQYIALCVTRTSSAHSSRPSKEERQCSWKFVVNPAWLESTRGATKAGQTRAHGDGDMFLSQGHRAPHEFARGNFGELCVSGLHAG
eukprot:2134631-Pyramimonas_sp.AAC.1